MRNKDGEPRGWRFKSVVVILFLGLINAGCVSTPCVSAVDLTRDAQNSAGLVTEAYGRDPAFGATVEAMVTQQAALRTPERVCSFLGAQATANARQDQAATATIAAERTRQAAMTVTEYSVMLTSAWGIATAMAQTQTAAAPTATPAP